MARGLLKTDKELQDVGEARLLIEGETAALAAERADPADLQQLDSLMEEMEQSLNRRGTRLCGFGRGIPSGHCPMRQEPNAF